ncbi:serine/threonine protein kinase, putative [Entamoeba histolytica KU27]|uniref:Serine/threonine protein kinase, putative n=1 Tax=Entamoeba histolytica KU27 TaxID=885311 RepID=M2RJ68_ENTHI|nr:serine/threonine protein kinase, putative [Entamoeba histolytica KU27]
MNPLIILLLFIKNGVTFNCSGSGCINCIGDELCEKCKDGYEQTTSCFNCMIVNPFQAFSESNPLYMMFNSECLQVNTENVKRYWDPRGAEELIKNKEVQFKITNTMIPAFGICENKDTNNRYKYGKYFHYTIPKSTTTQNYLNVLVKSDTPSVNFRIEITTDEFDPNKLTDSPKCFALYVLGTSKTTGFISLRVPQEGGHYYLFVGMKRGVDCTLTVSIVDNEIISPYYQVQEIDINNYEGEIMSHTVDFSSIGTYDYSVCSSIPMALKMIRLHLKGKVKQGMRLSLESTNGDGQIFEHSRCESKFGPCNCIEGFRTRRDIWSLNGQHGNIFSVDEHEELRWFSLFTTDVFMKTTLVMKYICPNGCNQNIGGGQCSTILSQCICTDERYGGDDCHLLCYSKEKWTISDTNGKCKYGVENCDTYCECQNNTIADQFYCVTQECWNYKRNESYNENITFCERGSSHCLPTCECEKGYSLIEGYCVSDLCGNGIYDNGEECDEKGYCTKFCTCEEGYEQDINDLTHCVHKAISMTELISIIVGGIILLLAIIIILCSILILVFARNSYTRLSDIPFKEKQPYYYINKTLLKEQKDGNNSSFHFDHIIITFGLKNKNIKLEDTRYETFILNNTSNEFMLFIVHIPDTNKFTFYSYPQTKIILPKAKQKIILFFTAHCTTTIENYNLIVSCYQFNNKEILSHFEEFIKNKHSLDEKEFKLYSEMVNQMKSSYCNLIIKGEIETSLIIDQDELLINQGIIEGSKRRHLGLYHNILVCIKQINLDSYQLEQRQKLKALFQRSTSLLKNIRSPYVVSTIGYIMSEESISIINALYPLRSLDLCMYYEKSNIVLPYKLKLKIMRDVECGLHYLHESKLLHNNLKPSNIILNSLFDTTNTVALITDYRVTKELSEEMENFGYFIGNPKYDAPELYNNVFVPESDVFSFSIVFWELFYGIHAFSDLKTTYDIKSSIIAGKRPELKLPMPQELQNLLEQCWNNDYHERPLFNIINPQLTKLIDSSEQHQDLDINVTTQKIKDVFEEDIHIFEKHGKKKTMISFSEYQKIEEKS